LQQAVVWNTGARPEGAGFMNQVVITGGGLAGQTLALALAQAGMEITLVDPRQPEPEPTPRDGRALALSWQTVCFLQSLGLEPALRDAEPLWHIQVTEGKARPLHFHARDAGPHPMGLMVDADTLQPALRKALDATRARQTRGTTPTGFQAVPGGWVVSGPDGPLAEGSLLVGADGKDSFLRRWAGIRTTRHPYNQTALVFRVTHPEPHEGRGFEHFLPSGPLALLPAPPREGIPSSSAVWTVPDSMAPDLLALDDATFSLEVSRRFPCLGPLTLCCPPRAWPLGLVWAWQTTGHRLVLVGDAARTLHPVAGQGFNLGIRHIEKLAAHLIRHHTLGLDPGATPGLRAWSRACLPSSLAMAAATHGVVALFSTHRSWPRGLGRQTMALTGAVPFLKNTLVRYAAGFSSRLT
jgi:2-octaprenyl-6-methoxyphenol hydroxylase